jgi:hypothetical protein
LPEKCEKKLAMKLPAGFFIAKVFKLLLQTFAIPELFGFPRFEHQISSTLLN